MAEVFAHYPDGRVTVIGRQVAGPWVLDHHRTTYGGGASEETVLCFRVDDGRHRPARASHHDLGRRDLGGRPCLAVDQPKRPPT